MIVRVYVNKTRVKGESTEKNNCKIQPCAVTRVLRPLGAVEIVHPHRELASNWMALVPWGRGKSPLFNILILWAGPRIKLIRDRLTGVKQPNCLRKCVGGEWCSIAMWGLRTN